MPEETLKPEASQADSQKEQGAKLEEAEISQKKYTTTQAKRL
jgi:hypothetical protein